jgi:SAM-dependent methyltransferase
VNPSSPETPEFTPACPSCGEPLSVEDGSWACQPERISFPLSDGIIDLIVPHRREALESFLQSYRAVRSAEGWGNPDSEYYLALPWKDISGRHKRIWRQRAASYDVLRRELLSCRGNEPLRVLDAGAGNCWLSLKLASEGHHVVALDPNIDEMDGLGVLRRMPPDAVRNILAVRAEFDRIPFGERTFDAIVFNASLHYSQDIAKTLMLSIRTLRDNGSIYVLDTPCYRDPNSGRIMVGERREDFRRRFGVGLPEEFAGTFLTEGLIRDLRDHCQVRRINPRADARARLYRIMASIRQRRELASMGMLVIKPKPSAAR